jgi:hypothetical protein
VIAKAGTLSVDSACLAMIAHADAAIRYWGARGLQGIVPSVISAGPARAIAAVQAALAKETSGVVAAELVHALAALNDYPALLDGLDKYANLFATAVPDVNMLSAATEGLNKLNAQTASKPAADKVRAARVSMRLASFTAQQNSAAAKAAEQGLPSDFVTAVNRLLEAATRVANAAGGASPAPALRPPTGRDADELLFNTGSTFGTPTNDGAVQGKITGVGRPTAIKAP